jgi:hypothetical protein
MTLLLALLLANLPPPHLPEEQVRPVVRGAAPRSQRPWVLSAELGWNGLAGIGLTVARHLDPHFTLEAGVGISAEAAKFGFRARWNLLAGEWTPFLGAGFLYGTGYGDSVFADSANGRAFSYAIGSSPFGQFVAGFEYQGFGGFNFLAAGGYARLLDKNLRILSGAPTDDDLSAVRIATGSGPVLSVSLGYAF